MSNDKIVGHKTLLDGSHVPLYESEAALIWEQINTAEAKREKDMPSSAEAIHAMWSGWYRLKELGWSRGVYCPKDGTEFAVIQLGSTGIFTAHYIGQWPNGHIILGDAVSRPEGCLWKPIESLTADEERARQFSIEAERQFIARLGNMQEQDTA